jgi:hypothetical protein
MGAWIIMRSGWVEVGAALSAADGWARPFPEEKSGARLGVLLPESAEIRMDGASSSPRSKTQTLARVGRDEGFIAAIYLLERIAAVTGAEPFLLSEFDELQELLV